MFYQIKQPGNLRWYAENVCLSDKYDIETNYRGDLCMNAPSKSQNILKITSVNSIKNNSHNTISWDIKVFYV